MLPSSIVRGLVHDRDFGDPFFVGFLCGVAIGDEDCGDAGEGIFRSPLPPFLCSITDPDVKSSVLYYFSTAEKARLSLYCYWFDVYRASTAEKSGRTFEWVVKEGRTRRDNNVTQFGAVWCSLF
jgi:hypothetical protein